MLESVVDLANTAGRKFQALADSINDQASVIQQGEATYGILGLVSRVEEFLKSTIEKKVGVRVQFTTDKSGGYLDHISVSGPSPLMTLKRKFTLDIINAAKKGDVRSVVNSLKNEVTSHVREVRAGNIGEKFEREYLVFEVEGTMLGPDSQGTLASFRGVLPVDKLSLVDTDKERDYIPKEVKKDYFVLHPAKEGLIYKHEKDYLQRTVINALYNKSLSEKQLSNYLQIARSGNYTIVKEHLSESTNNHYRQFGEKLTVSEIRHHKEI